MRPSFFIFFFQLIITTCRKQAANSYMHQVLLLFLGKFFTYVAKFLYADQKKNGFHVGLLAKAFYQFCFKVPPALLKIITNKHAAKIFSKFFLPLLRFHKPALRLPR